MKKIFIVSLVLAAAGCGGQKVSDQGPKFKISSTELGISDLESAVVNLRRGEPDVDHSGAGALHRRPDQPAPGQFVRLRQAMSEENAFAPAQVDDLVPIQANQ